MERRSTARMQKVPQHCKAAAGGHAEVVRILLTAQADPNAGTAPRSALWLALDSDAAGAGEMVQLLVSAGANTLTAHPTTGAPWHILFAAATENKVGWIQRLIAAGCNPDVEGPSEGGFSRTPLVLAMKTGSLEAAVELLRSGAAPDTREVAMCLVAAALAGCEAMVQQLADAGADMSLAIYAAAVLLGATTAADGTGTGARLESSVEPVVAAAVAPARLHASATPSTAATTSTAAVQLHLPAAIADAAGNTAGAATAAVGTTAAAQLGAVAPLGERPAREQAAQAGTGVAAATRPVGRARARADIRLLTWTTAAEERAAMQLLIRVAGGINATGYRGGTALHAAAVHGATEAVQVLLQHGAALDVAVEHGVTALGLAYCNREVAVVQLLLAAGAKPSGSDVLCAAAAESAEADLQSFLAAGAPATETEPGTGSTALYLATRNGVSASPFSSCWQQAQMCMPRTPAA